MDALEGMLELAERRHLMAQGEGARGQALEARVRGRLARAAAITSGVTESLFLAIRLLEKTLARGEAAAPEPGGSAAACLPDEASKAEMAHVPGASSCALLVGPDAAWFELDRGDRVDLRRRGAVRRIFHGLVEQRLLAPGVGLGLEVLFEQGWPGQEIHPDAAATRVYSGIRTLRSLGLTMVLLRHADGYLVDPSLSIARSSG